MMVAQFVSYVTQPPDDVKKQHRLFLKEQVDRKRLVMAGRYADKNGSLMLWRVNSLAEAQEMLMEEPYFKNGFATFVLKEWTLTWDLTANPPLMPEIP